MGLKGCQKILHSCDFNESSLSIERVQSQIHSQNGDFSNLFGNFCLKSFLWNPLVYRIQLDVVYKYARNYINLLIDMYMHMGLTSMPAKKHTLL